MNPKMQYFKATVLQSELRDEARRSRQAELTAEAEKGTVAAPSHKRGDHSLFGLLGLALPGRR